MGWDGTEVTPQIKSLIEDHHLGSIILTAKNLKCLSLPLISTHFARCPSALHAPELLALHFPISVASPRILQTHDTAPCPLAYSFAHHNNT
jgi:hypothetical protein